MDYSFTCRLEQVLLRLMYLVVQMRYTVYSSSDCLCNNMLGKLSFEAVCVCRICISLQAFVFFLQCCACCLGLGYPFQLPEDVCSVRRVSC